MFEFKQYEQKTITQEDLDRLNAQLNICRINLKKYEGILEKTAASYNMTTSVGVNSILMPASSNKLQECYDSLQRYKILLESTTYAVGENSIQAISKMEMLSIRIKEISRRLRALYAKDYTADLYDKENQKHIDDLLTMSIKSDIHPKYKKAFKAMSKHLDKINVLDYDFILSVQSYTSNDELALQILHRFKATNLPFGIMYLKYDYKYEPNLLVYERKPEYDTLINGLDKIFCKIINKHLIEYNAQKKLELINFFLHKYLYDNDGTVRINAFNPSMKQYID